MTKEQVERGVAKALGCIDVHIAPIPMVHKGNHRWESGPIATTESNSGLFHNLFSTFSVTVHSPPCANIGNPDFSVFRIEVRWDHRDRGSNGASLDYFYRASTDEVLTREEAIAVFQV